MEYKELKERRDKIYNKVDDGVDFGSMENTHELLLYMEGVDDFLPRVFNTNKKLREKNNELREKFKRANDLNNFFIDQMQEDNKRLTEAMVFISDAKITAGLMDNKQVGKICKSVDEMEDKIEGKNPLRKLFYNLATIFIRKQPRK
jgi:hypothetical protein